MFSTRIAYVTRAGQRYTLRVADADGENGQVALNSGQPIISPAWSPNGKELAYVSFERQKAVVFVHNVATGERRAIADFRGSNSAPAWSPDGERAGGHAVARRRLAALPRSAGTAASRAASRRSPAIDTEAEFSADGRYLYFTSDRGGAPQIYRMPAGGGNAERVTFSGAYNISPAVSPDGRTLAYITRSGNAFRLVVLDLATPGAQPQPITDTSDDEHPSFAPNGRLLIYATRAAGPQRVDDDHARWQDQGSPAVADGRSARAGVGPVRALDASRRRARSFESGQQAKETSMNTLPSSSPHRRRRRLAGRLLERASSTARRRSSRAPARAVATGTGAGANGAGSSQTRVAPVDVTGTSNVDYSNLPRVVYFDFDSYVVKDDYRPVIEANAKALTANRKTHMAVEGHTDERGSSEYNLALGQRRAEAVVKSLSCSAPSRPSSRPVSFGKERPAVQGEDEEAWAKNRRAELASTLSMRAGCAAQAAASRRGACVAVARLRRCRRTPASSTTTRRAARSSICASSSSRATSRRAPARPSRWRRCRRRSTSSSAACST